MTISGAVRGAVRYSTPPSDDEGQVVDNPSRLDSCKKSRQERRQFSYLSRLACLS